MLVIMKLFYPNKFMRWLLWRGKSWIWVERVCWFENIKIVSFSLSLVPCNITFWFRWSVMLVNLLYLPNYFFLGLLVFLVLEISKYILMIMCHMALHVFKFISSWGKSLFYHILSVMKGILELTEALSFLLV